ncbi:MAG: asparagine synthase C-terminal domain-containing protein [Betaproteobacteria bacterium]|nr:asparagine synthase C-terminal domain-containing protein [Gammaproteobacteria bacterium]MDH3436816.1 asparagine synthase C-terminal domain-containing protein [Betaproteobacteria bacterium]
MSGLCGWFDPKRSGPADPQVIEAMAAPLNRFDGSAVRSASAGFGAVAAAGTDLDIFQDDHQLVAVWGRARFSDADLGALAQRDGMARAIAQGYARKGADVLTALAGTFALAILDGRGGEAVLAIDRMGTRPLCYCVAVGTLVFGSTLDSISAFPGSTAEIDQQAIYDYVYFHMVPGPRTIHVGRHRLLPGTFLLWRNGKAETRSYWEMRFAEDERPSFPELKKEFLTLLREGVREAAQGDTVGTFLSGGTDSSTLAGMLGEVTGKPARTYSIGFEAQGYDEMHYARIAARHFGTRHQEYYVTPDDVVSAIPLIAAVHDQPFGNSSAVPTYYCAKLAKGDGVDTLLGGDGGDELFGGNERYAKQYLYSLYSDLPRDLRKGLIEPVLGLLPSVSLMGKAQRYVTNASMPMPARYDNYNLLERLGADNVFTANFLDIVDAQQPRAMMEQAYSGAQAQSLINRILALDLRFTLADNDLPKVTRSCELACIDVRYPLLSDSIVAFSAGLSPRLKLKGTRLRYFFKEALRGFLPDEIIAKSKHGFGLPFGPWLQTHRPLRQLALGSLTDLKERGIVRPEFIDELTSTHVASHAGYYGTMVWVLMMLEQWLRRHGAAA